ncbi:MAG: TonB-dependent receptor plug [Bacteroidetes bacterium]|nr:MAG: TonB-dependent receptor plug [Bacteroidota bacterium]
MKSIKNKLNLLKTGALTLFLLTGTASGANAQTTISGQVTDLKKQPVANANVFIKDSYDGATADAQGKYSFSTSETGNMMLVCSMMGYGTVEKPVALNGGTLTIDITLEGKVQEFDVVVISAGTIEASDEKKTTVLKPLDIVTTAGASGDIYGALKTLPGTQQVGESEGLFVRGGTGAETKTIIDGMAVNNPFFSSVPDIASRGRFSPFLFKGTVFSTGGYSAQYGQALSSVLVLETQDLPERTSSTLAVSSVGVGGGHNQLWKEKNMSAGFDINYTNLAPYFALVKQLPDYVRKPEFTGGSLNFRKKTSETGILKFYGYFNLGDLALRRQDIDSIIDYKSLFDLKNDNVYTNLSYREYVGRWRVDAATSFSHNRDRIIFDADSISAISQLSQGRVMMQRGLGIRSQIRFGGEYQYLVEDGKYNQYAYGFFDNYGSGFAEADFYFGPKIVARAGGRFESSSILAKTCLAPRASLAFKTGNNSQASVAYGDFYQKPERDYLYTPAGIGYEKATPSPSAWKRITKSTASC